MSSNSGDGGVATQAQTQQRKPKSKTKAFQGTGNRLGSANDPPPHSATASAGSPNHDVDLPAKRVDPSLTTSERERQRVARLAAAEKRQKASGVSTKKKKTTQNQPLRGPNTEPLMRWNA